MRASSKKRISPEYVASLRRSFFTGQTLVGMVETASKVGHEKPSLLAGLRRLGQEGNEFVGLSRHSEELPARVSVAVDHRVERQRDGVELVFLHLLLPRIARVLAIREQPHANELLQLPLDLGAG